MANLATREAYGKALVELGKENKDVVVLDADLSKSTKTADFAKAFPDRFFNMGIAEGDMMATAAGFATCGKIPFASTFAIFASGRAFEQIRNSICYPELNVKVVATHAGLTVGEDGATHQSVEDLAIMRAIPNMTVICPCDDVETMAAIKEVAAMKGPVYIRLGRSSVPTLNNEADYKFEIGKAVTLREGKDVTIFATGIMVSEALKAADLLEKQGIDAQVINIHTIKPIDEKAVIEAAKKTGAVVTCEEHSVVGGLGSAVCEVLSEYCPVPVKRVGVMDMFGESGKPAELLKEYGLTAENIVEAAKAVVENKK
ncbi:transketolase family protein [Caloramator sp. E03]|uniref:transketolase family protein n=1 Tax=Caloramator sp. E03 TaxID=2576307 RepID=UPI0011105817|nr:transketolase family protein [Caloramator sp. E03]QCX34440.1 transketolase family protein [Caloramator sp. E03]